MASGSKLSSMRCPACRTEFREEALVVVWVHKGADDEPYQELFLVLHNEEQMSNSLRVDEKTQRFVSLREGAEDDIEESHGGTYALVVL
ncbi:hypothetical protein THAOC_11018 [Thalassiosira oceanica]|uniref:Ig-like domain-containing protein n=1 Tax=Thalassiosira oceanica TaxID=159749 RepID=K0SR50_THAOC|nr:hypothetical protein THAOC_11018 [Thalassiosira oceanica]|eukprot:EJK67880.1 hypothetical protein THAOC_11018 [Thalassiosira oceanica]